MVIIPGPNVWFYLIQRNKCQKSSSFDVLLFKHRGLAGMFLPVNGFEASWKKLSFKEPETAPSLLFSLDFLHVSLQPACPSLLLELYLQSFGQLACLVPSSPWPHLLLCLPSDPITVFLILLELNFWTVQSVKQQPKKLGGKREQWTMGTCDMTYLF